MSRTNHLAHSLGIKNWRRGVQVLSHPMLRAERLGQIGKHFFVGKIEIASRQNLIAKYVKGSSPWLKFLGLTSGSTAREGIATQLTLDDDIKATGPAQKVEVAINGERESKKLQVRLFVAESQTIPPSLLHSDKLTVESDTKMPVMMGNETIAHTPIEVRGLAKHIQLIVPQP
jgi:hypothetical protein